MAASTGLLPAWTEAAACRGKAAQWFCTSTDVCQMQSLLLIVQAANSCSRDCLMAATQTRLPVGSSLSIWGTDSLTHLSSGGLLLLPPDRGVVNVAGGWLLLSTSVEVAVQLQKTLHLQEGAAHCECHPACHRWQDMPRSAAVWYLVT